MGLYEVVLSVSLVFLECYIYTYTAVISDAFYKNIVIFTVRINF